jgi:hypothetical protein
MLQRICVTFTRYLRKTLPQVFKLLSISAARQSISVSDAVALLVANVAALLFS